MLGRHSRLLFPIRVIRVMRGRIHPLGGVTSRRPFHSLSLVRAESPPRSKPERLQGGRSRRGALEASPQTTLTTRKRFL